MNIASTELKSLLKQVGSVKSQQLILCNGGIVAKDSDLMVCASSDKFEGIPNISVDYRKFASVTNRMTGQIDISYSGNTLTIKSAKAKVEMEYAEPKPYTFTRPEKLISLPLSEVKNLLKYVSVSADPNKAAFMGGVVQFESTKSGLFDDEKLIGFEAMGTNGNRCAYAGVLADVGAEFKYIVPLPAVAAIQALDGSVLEMGETDSFLYFKSDKATVYASQLSKKFPDYRSFLPKEFTFTATVDSGQLKQLLHTVEPMTQDIENFGISVHFLDGILKVRTVGKGGSAADEMDYQTDPLADVTEFSIKINHRYLSDYVSSISGDITFNGNGPKQPIVLEAGAKKIMIAAVIGGSE